MSSSDEFMVARQEIASDILSDSTGTETFCGSALLEDMDTEKGSETLSAVPSDRNPDDAIGSVSSATSIKSKSKEKPVDALISKERQLQTARQMWAIFDALGPSKAPKKCDRPFVGRQQELYEECVALTAAIHKNELKVISLNETFDSKLSTMEVMFILKGLPKSSELIPLPTELTIMHSWFFELKAFEKTSHAFVKKKPFLFKMFTLDNLSFAVSYVLDEGTEVLSFSTRRHEKVYNICITLNADTLDLKLERKEQEPKVHFSINDLVHCVVKAAKMRVGAHQLVRHILWKYIDKAEEVIHNFSDNNGG